MSKTKTYNFKEIEGKWQSKWEGSKPYHAITGDNTRKKFYGLIEFPYPSAAGLHVGHARPFTAMDIISRKRRMEGYNVLFPIGFDAFGLPTENYAIKNHVHPAKVTHDNIMNFTKQLKALGYSFDWDRVVDTTNPDYYKWTQWIFLQLYKHGLAYKASIPVNWCTSCKCVLANEEVVDGHCERCGSDVIRREKSQWMLALRKYAGKLLDDLDNSEIGIDYPERVKAQQRNWIGRSTGMEVNFNIKFKAESIGHSGELITVYTTRCDTMFGVTYMVISPEHPVIKKWIQDGKISNVEEIRVYQEKSKKKSDLEREQLNKEKTGVRIDGVVAINPATCNEIPIFISDYVLMSYGTGAVMGVPGHDQRDWDFAKRFNLPIIEVVSGGDISKQAFTIKDDTGIMVNSGFLNGMTVKEAIPAMRNWVEEQGFGTRKVNYRLRDWVFSRQRYWGEPIPLVYCKHCIDKKTGKPGTWVPVPESELPIKLPEVESYEPTDDGESPLSAMKNWVNTVCPVCGNLARRETDTMPQWAGSSWYYLRYMDRDNDKEVVSKEAYDYWGPVDWYNGGMEHTTLHLLYSRFWHKFLYDIGVVGTPEPYMKRTSHGMILGRNPYCWNVMTDEEKAVIREQCTPCDGKGYIASDKECKKYLRSVYGEMVEQPYTKMSKSLGNVINPDEVISVYGADTLRLYVMFVGEFEQTAAWSENGVKGCKRFLDKVWSLMINANPSMKISIKNEAEIHKAIKKVSNDIEVMGFNTAIASLMGLSNRFVENGVTYGDMEVLIKLLSPFAPHICEEMWEMMGYAGKTGHMVCQEAWPSYNESKTINKIVKMAVQVNGKMKGIIEIASDSEQDEVMYRVMENDKFSGFFTSKEIKRIIFVKNRIINIIVTN